MRSWSGALALVAAALLGGCATPGGPDRLASDRVAELKGPVLFEHYMAHAHWNAYHGANAKRRTYTEDLRQRAITDDTESTAEERADLRMRRIWQGMSERQLLLSWGPPLKTTQHNTPTMAVTIWDYAPYSYRMTREVWVSNWKVVWWTQSEH